MRKILVTGCAGFIGSHTVDRLLDQEFEVVGVDNFNNYYDPVLKEKNILAARNSKKFKLYRADIVDFDNLKLIFREEKPDRIIHLAARAGVRPSITNPNLYSKVNVLGTVNLLKLSKNFDIEQFILGSSSSVYGVSGKLPFSEDDLCQNIISPYGASKRSAELFVEAFHRNSKMRFTILRFFTVYGPRGRPDMAPAIFAKSIMENREILQFGDGTSSRDYTYIDDVVDGIIKACSKNFQFEIINLGNSSPVKLGNFIKIIEQLCLLKAKIRMMPKQVGDVEKTWANVEKAKKLLGWEPKTSIRDGLNRYIEWLENRQD